MLRLNALDKKILKLVLRPTNNGFLTSKMIATKLSVSATTVQRRRRRMEKAGFLMPFYKIDSRQFGWHEVDFLVSTQCGKTIEITKKLAKMEEVVSITRTIGQPTIDIRVETILRNNDEILDMLETIKGTEGVRDAIWTERVECVIFKAPIPIHLIDKI